MYSLNGIPLKKKKKSERTDKRTDGRTNGQSDYIMPQILFGGIKTSKKKVIAKKLFSNLYEMNSKFNDLHLHSVLRIHFPVSLHSAVSLPVMLKPLSHSYITVDPKVDPVALTMYPLLTAVGVPQFLTAIASK